MRKLKINVYAIAKNEEQFVKRWVKSMKEADNIYVLDTGSTDNTVKKLKELGVNVVEESITPWRFDVARNESMKLIPEDSDVLICTDIDERLDSDFWNDLRKIVFEHPNFNRIFYRYAWSHDEKGNPKWVFWYDKITQVKGWKWKFPVHEALVCSDDSYEGQYYMPEDKIYLHHYPDQTKSRSSYLGLLKQPTQSIKN